VKIPLAIAVIGLLVLGLRWAFVPSGRVPRFRVMVTRLRLRLRLHPGRGYATVLELWLRWSRLACFFQSRRARPSLSLWRRMTHPGEHSVFVGRAQYRHGLRLAIQEHLTIFGPPRTGKSGFLAKIILRYGGAVVSTSTKPDMFALTSGIRAGRGPVFVFNPQRIGGPAAASTIRWNPVGGCQEASVAIRRAQAFCEAVSTEGTEDNSFWTEQAASQLRALLCAAALAGADLSTVADWILSGQTQDAEEILAAAGRGAWAATVAQMRGKAEKTTATIRLVLTSAIAFMADPALAECVLPGEGGGFDIEQFLRQQGTLYLIGESRGQSTPIAPLFAGLVSEIHWTATQLGSAMRGARLDPPLALVLDEVTQIVPVPLPSILADSGGRGIQIITACHGLAQLRARWREHGARAVLDTSNQLFLGGILDPDTLEMASSLCGQAALRERGEEKTARHPVAPVEVIRQLPARRALVLRGSAAPVIAHLPMAWHDRRYLAARLHGREIAPLQPVLATAGLDEPVHAYDQADIEAEAAGAVLIPDLVGAPADIPRDGDDSSYPWDGTV
jgi:type IV secretion system protein VirD4